MKDKLKKIKEEHKFDNYIVTKKLDSILNHIDSERILAENYLKSRHM